MAWNWRTTKSWLESLRDSSVCVYVVCMCVWMICFAGNRSRTILLSLWFSRLGSKTVLEMFSSLTSKRFLAHIIQSRASYPSLPSTSRNGSHHWEDQHGPPAKSEGEVHPGVPQELGCVNGVFMISSMRRYRNHSCITITTFAAEVNEVKRNV